MKNIIIGLVSLLILLVVVAAYQLSKFFSVSSGALIAKYQNPKTAVLVMDMQIEFADTAQKIIGEVNKTADYFSSKNDIVIYIKTEYSKSDHILNFVRKNSAVAGSDGVNFLPELKVVSQNVFVKDRMDAFANPALDDFLVKNEIGRIYIAGLDGCYCVDKTAQAALKRGYKVTLLSDASVSKKESEFAAVKEGLKAKGASIIPTGELIK